MEIILDNLQWDQLVGDLGSGSGNDGICIQEKTRKSVFGSGG